MRQGGGKRPETQWEKREVIPSDIRPPARGGGCQTAWSFLRSDLPSSPDPSSSWPSFLPAVMGSPDPYGRQLLNGFWGGGGGMAGNCGNICCPSLGPAALDQNLLILPRVPEVNEEDGTVTVRIQQQLRADLTRGDYKIDGGAKTGKARHFPTGNATDTLILSDGTEIQASLVDVSNPGVFIRASDLGNITGVIVGWEGLNPERVEGNVKLKEILEEIRKRGAEMMGLGGMVESVPKIVLIFPQTEKGEQKGGEEEVVVDIKCLALSMGQAHKAVPLTLALCLGAASSMPGTIPHQLRRQVSEGGKGETGETGEDIPSGRVEVGTVISEDGEILSAELHRTARVLMKGEVFY
ncbi:methylitaconate delta2-delta3-isomerase [Diplogelasinospora grovesii]|uniref:Methylitaconate delta2-delta3-isomerase n=1 Tax=Diplogelasinospora grovesii TaxID=303347 RepID=A0AAN6N7D0_9PEZI|nr:methylitaconate delta2-delta3-isomerase [Diplogelasinospora grovesii]